MKEKIKNKEYYIGVINELQKLKKNNPNDFTLGTKVRDFLNCLISNNEYIEKEKGL